MSDLVQRLRFAAGFDRDMSTRECFNLVEEAADELERLQAEVEALRKDAERYRWLRSGARERQGVAMEGGARTIARDHLRALMAFNYWCSAEELDAAIDAAAAKRP